MSSRMQTIVGIETERLLGVAREAARAGSAVAMCSRRDLAALELDEEAVYAVLGEVRRETEQAIRDLLTTLRPGDAVVGKERADTAGASGVRWLVDPIDSNAHYLADRDDWAVSVAAIGEEDGRPLAGAVMEPARERLTEACSGGGAWSDGHPVRCSAAGDLSHLLLRVADLHRGAGAAAALAQVAGGRVDACWVTGMGPGDGAAGALLVSEAGGVVGDLSGEWPVGGEMLASAPGLWEPIRDLLLEAYGVPG